METVLMRYGWDCLWNVVQCKCHQALCHFLYDHQEGEKVSIPDEFRPKETNLEETPVETNVYRWVVFVLWLEPHPNALRWYRIIQKAHPHSVPTIQTLWDYCQ